MLTTLKYTCRVLAIGWTLARHDALFGLEALGVSPVTTWLCRRVARRHNGLRAGQRLAAALQELGPSFIKVGQALSTRSDLVGEAIATDLTLLQDRLPAFDSREAIATVESQLDGPISQFFNSFDEHAVAAASIAQVHFATTTEGREVAVKVLRPNIEAAFARDIELMFWLARMAERKSAHIRKRFKPMQVAQTLADMFRVELDLRYEAAAAEELKHNTRNDSDFYVPAVDWQRSATRVLTTERVRGFHASDAAGMTAAGLDVNDITRKAAGAFFNQVFRDGFFHADMHPGNLFVLPDGRLAPVDFGIMGRIDHASQLYLAEILWGFLKEDYMHVARVHRDAGYIPSHVSLEQFAQACMAVGKPIMGKALNEISVGRLLGQLIAIADTFEMEVQPHLLLLQKTMITAEGVGRGLNPNVNMWKLSEPLIAAWAKEHLSPRARIKNYAKETAEVIRDMPRVLRETKAFMDDIRAHGFTLSPESMAGVKNQRATQHRALIRLGWVLVALLTSVLGLEIYRFLG